MSLSQEMYTRIYRLYKRNINNQSIATTLNIPLRTVQSIVARFDTVTHEDELAEKIEDSSLDNEIQSSEGFLDIYFYQRTRYTIIQFVGTLTSNFLDNINQELEKAFKSNWKAVAIRLHDVTVIDQKISELLLSYFEKFNSLSKYFAILDPSENIESSLRKFNIEEKIPVFGTERAFEDNAFTKKSNFAKRL